MLVWLESNTVIARIAHVTLVQIMQCKKGGSIKFSVSKVNLKLVPRY